MKFLKSPACLSIAGSDCSGSAGIQADLKVMQAYGVYGMSVLTALTSQNSKGIDGIYSVHPLLIQRQLDACLSDIECHTVKIGMLPDSKSVLRIAETLQRHQVKNIVMDSVIISSAGHIMCERTAIAATIKHLFPHVLVYSSNIMEAYVLVQRALGHVPFALHSFDDIQKLVTIIHKAGPKFIVLNGYHVAYNENFEITSMPTANSFTINLIFDGKTFYVFQKPYDLLHSKAVHGTSCSITAAIASNLALGKPPIEAIQEAMQSIECALLNTQEDTSSINRSAQLFSKIKPSCSPSNPIVTFHLRSSTATTELHSSISSSKTKL
ncbi:phosphomethylpyrimidine kinase [Schizosaccharomyces cryophilus OY26]|uniref:Phosphomethylpyrimidine kinase n=1 Tax=Schizosaccharomyces cryophilus (strain OY26 / ATCC MYA-4695 / CBS 11777 / NBRC 106824 / NRRL Y48691) TaxID=653667 RepID=S9VUM1_SCHCR|nr:phosphomethylpyrimidine kinase [Schizosaccharomyces cryophilus OY26]EPY49854.1 phosphomethylpyrimidine kinase [Schizosaccharomyces cryophilus OY26]